MSLAPIMGMNPKIEQALDLNGALTQALKAFYGERYRRVKNDPQYVALFVVELFLALLLVAAIYFYLDPTINLVPAPYNYVAFAALFAAAMWVYRYTHDYRQEKKKPKAKRACTWQKKRGGVWRRRTATQLPIRGKTRYLLAHLPSMMAWTFFW